MENTIKVLRKNSVKLCKIRAASAGSVHRFVVKISNLNAEIYPVLSIIVIC